MPRYTLRSTLVFLIASITRFGAELRDVGQGR